MSTDWILTLVPIVGVGADIVVQIALAHLTRRVGLSIVAGVLCGLLTVIGTVLGVVPDRATAHAAATWAVLVSTYLALAFGYWTVLNLNITSLRIRMLRELLHVPDGISQRELLARYSAEEFLRRRLERLELGKQMSCAGGYWRLESRLLLVLAGTMTLARAVILPPQREE